MQVTKLKDAKRYEAANHFDVSALRLQGAEATKTGHVLDRPLPLSAGRQGRSRRLGL